MEDAKGQEDQGKYLKLLETAIRINPALNGYPVDVIYNSIIYAAELGLDFPTKRYFIQ